MTPNQTEERLRQAAETYTKREFGDYETTSLEGRVKISTSKEAFIAGAHWQSQEVKPSEVKSAEEYWIERAYDTDDGYVMTRDDFMKFAAQFKLQDAGEKEGWISVEDSNPKKHEGQMLVTNGNGFVEIVWYDKEEGEFCKPFRYDSDDHAAFRKGNFSHWRPLPAPPSINTKR